MLTNHRTTPIKSGVAVKPIGMTASRKSADVGANPERVQDIEDNDDLYRMCRGFLILGKFYGILPYNGIFSKSSTNLKFKWISIPSVLSYIILLILSFNCVLEIVDSITVQKHNAYEVANSVRGTLYHVWGTLIYFYFVIRHTPFINIFQVWRSTPIYYSKKDKHLKRDIILMAFIILASATLENTVLYAGHIGDVISYLKGNKRESNMTLLESYYTSSHKNWDRFIGYNPFVALLAFVQHKWIMYAWNYMDILIAIFARALYFKFKSLCELSNENLVLPWNDMSDHQHSATTVKPTAESNKHDNQGWVQLDRDYKAVCELLKSLENFLSPLIFASYTVNIYYICMQLVEGLTVGFETHTLWASIQAPWSFLHLILRIYIVSICGARINLYAHQIGDVILHCPSECYSTHLSRLDKRVTTGRDIGLSGIGCFTITKPFILTIIGVIFTFEIVLLQVYHPTPTNTCCCT